MGRNNGRFIKIFKILDFGQPLKNKAAQSFPAASHLDFFLPLRYGVIPDLVQMRSDLVDWVEFVSATETVAPKPFQPLIDLGEEADEPVNGLDGPDKSGHVGGKDGGGLEFVRLKPLQLCIVKIQNLLKVSLKDKFRLLLLAPLIRLDLSSRRLSQSYLSTRNRPVWSVKLLDNRKSTRKFRRLSQFKKFGAVIR